MILYQLKGPTKKFNVYRERLEIQSTFFLFGKSKTHISYDQIEKIEIKKQFIIFNKISLKLKNGSTQNLLTNQNNSTEFALKFINRQIELYQRPDKIKKVTLLTNVKDLVDKKKPKLTQSA